MTKKNYDTIIHDALLKANEIQYCHISGNDSDISYSDEYSDYIQNLFDRFDDLKNYQGKSRISRHKYLAAAASFIIAIVISVSSILALSPVARAAVVNWFSEISDCIATYTTLGNRTESLSETEVASNILHNLAVPDGYYVSEKFDNPALGYIIYASDENEQLLTVQFTSMSYNSGMSVSSQNMQHSEVQLSVCMADLYVSQEETGNTLVWADESSGWIYCIDGFFSGDKLADMAESLY